MTNEPGDLTTLAGRVDQIDRLVEFGLHACEAYERPDLASCLLATRELLRRPGIHVVVCGEFKQGKSSLVNALLNAQLCPVDDDIATAVPTFIRWGEQASLEVSQFAEDATQEPDRQSISFDELRQHVVEQPAENPRGTNRVDVELPRPILSGGLVIVDTPGVGGLGSAHATATLAALPIAEAAIFVSDASQEYTETEIEFLGQARELCSTVVCVLTKTDLYPAWRKIHDLNVGHLAREGISVKLLDVSAALRIESIRTNDTDLDSESGFAALESFLRDQVTAGVLERTMRSAIIELLAVMALMKSPFEAERAALADPATAQKVVDDLSRAKEQAEQLKGGLARWNVTLQDGTTDLMSDVDHDFRRRIRDLVDEANLSIDGNEPADIWTEFEPWLYARVSAEVVANYAYLQERSAELTDLVGEHFRDASGDIAVDLAAFDPKPVLAGTAASASTEFDSKSIAGRGLGQVRGGQSGLLMFRTFSGFALTSMNPLGAPIMALSLAAGLVTGRSSSTDERKRELTQHRAQAKATVRKYTDDISFTIGKDLRESMHRVQRQIRDHYALRAEELHFVWG